MLQKTQEMYKFIDYSDEHISLHDCHATKMTFVDGVLSFVFEDGFWIGSKHEQNHSEETVRTGIAQVDFDIIDKEIEGIEINTLECHMGRTICRKWLPRDFMEAVNAGKFSVEFIIPYKGYQSLLFKCWVWYKKAPYYSECEIILHSENARYCWNELQYDCTW